MGLGSTAKKIQGLSDRAEQMYNQVQELQQRIINLEAEVDETHETVTGIDHQLTEQRALLVAIADEHDLDTESILEEAVIEDAEETTETAETTDADEAELSAPDG